MSNKIQRYTVYFIWKLLYMFRLVPPPIIRSANNCIYSVWYLSHHYCYLPLSWKSWNWFDCAVGGVHQCLLWEYFGTDTPQAPSQGVQLGALHQLQFWIHPLGIWKILKADMLISPLKILRHGTASACCLCWPAVVGNTSFLKMCVYARCFVQRYREQALCN